MGSSCRLLDDSANVGASPSMQRLEREKEQLSRAEGTARGSGGRQRGDGAHRAAETAQGSAAGGLSAVVPKATLDLIGARSYMLQGSLSMCLTSMLSGCGTQML